MMVGSIFSRAVKSWYAEVVRREDQSVGCLKEEVAREVFDGVEELEVVRGLSRTSLGG